MDCLKIAAKQRGFLLHCQVTEEEWREAVMAGSIGLPPEDHQIFMEYVHYTELTKYALADGYYRDWLMAFPTVPPEERQPMPYLAGREALEVRGILLNWPAAISTMVVTPPELMPYINKEPKYTYIVDGNITADDWELIDDTPTEKALPAMRKYYEHVHKDDLHNAIRVAFGASYEGYSWDEIAQAAEPAAKVWRNPQTGQYPTTGKEVLDLFFEYHSG